ncbi:ribonuclease H-like domain-containing protein [Tanacetum coccineum]
MSFHKCPKLAKHFSDNIPKTVDEMLKRVDDYLRSEEAFRNMELQKANSNERTYQYSGYIGMTGTNCLNQEFRRPRENRVVLKLDSLSKTPLRNLSHRAPSEKEMLADIAETFDNLKRINMKLNPKKVGGNDSGGGGKGLSMVELGLWDKNGVEKPVKEDASDTGVAPKQQQQVIPQTTAISNIKLPILKKEEISTGNDGVIRILPPLTAAKIQAVEKEKKAKNILLMAIPKEHMRRFHGMDDAKEIWEAIKTRFGGNANSKKMQKAVFKQQFKAFTISSSEGLEKGYDRFQQLLSQLEAHSAEVSTEDANHKFLRSLPSAWSNLAITIRTKPDVDTLSIDDLYNNLRVFEQEIQALAGFADEVIYSLFAKQSENWDLLHEDLEQIDDLDIEEMDINWQIAMIVIRMKKFYKKIGRRVCVDGKAPAGFDKKKLECFNCHNTGHFARECTAKGTHDGKKKRDSFYQHQEAGKQEKNQMGLLTMDDGIVNWGEHTEDEETNHALVAISSSSEVSLCSKTCIDSYNTLKTLCDEQMNQLGDQEAQILAYSQAVKKLEAQLVTFQKQQLSLNEKLTFQANEIYEKDEKLKKYRRIGMKAVKEKEQLQKTLDSWKDSSKNLWRLINSGMSSNSKVGLGYEIQSNNEVLSYEEEMNFSVFNCSEEDSVGKPLYSRFIKTNDFKGVPHPLSGDYTPTYEHYKGVGAGSLRIHIEQRIAAMMGYRGGRHMEHLEGDVGSLYYELLRLKASLDVLFVPCCAAAEMSHQEEMWLEF